MNRKRNVLVIGAGLGGIAAAARLSRAGHNVTVVEKNAAPGGRCSQLIREGHRFDVGPTLFLMPEVFKETYASLGEQMNQQLDLRRIDPTYNVHFRDGTELTLTADLNVMQQQLEALEPGSFGGYLRYLEEGHRHYKIALESFVGRNFESLLDYFSLSNLPLLFQMKALVKHYDNVGRYFDDPRLKAAFTFQDMYLGLSPYDAPATYSLLSYTELADGIWYPMGGMYAIVESLVAIAESLGVHFLYDAPVSSIEVAGNRATGVVLKSGRQLNADVVIANADLPYVYSHLLPDEQPAAKLEQKEYTCSAVTFYWGVDKVYPQLDTHNVFLANEYKASFNRIFRDHTLPDAPSFYVHAPTRVDPAAAPVGQDTLMALVPIGHLQEDTDQDWPTLVERARSIVLHRLAENGVEDLEAHIKFETAYTPLTWHREFNLAKGAAFGLSHNFLQVGYLRPRNRHDRYHNLYFVGASTHPGTGLPIVLLSARLTTERVLQDAGQESATADLRLPEAAPTVGTSD